MTERDPARLLSRAEFRLSSLISDIKLSLTRHVSFGTNVYYILLAHKFDSIHSIKHFSSMSDLMPCLQLLSLC